MSKFSQDIKDCLRSVFWIGGSPCSGKSSVAKMLSEKYSCPNYACDEAYERHLQNAVSKHQPIMSQVAALTWDQIWMHPVELLLEREIELYKKEFPMIVQDLLTLNGGSHFLVEGTALLPELVAQVLSYSNQALWIVPTEEFQREKYKRRYWIENILNQCSSPEQAYENWMLRDIGYAQFVKHEASERSWKVIEINGTVSLSDITQEVASHFGWQAR